MATRLKDEKINGDIVQVYKESSNIYSIKYNNKTYSNIRVNNKKNLLDEIKVTLAKDLDNALDLPIQTVIIVPSTKAKDVKISETEFQKRIKSTRLKLSELFGGYTSVESVGGYMADNGVLIREDAVQVISYAQKSDYNKHKNDFLEWVARKKITWESLLKMIYIIYR